MNWNISHPLARLARAFRYRPAQRPAGRPRCRPVLEYLEDRSLLSTMGVVPAGSLASSSPVPPPVVVRAADVPQPVDFPDVFTTSSVNVAQNLTIAAVKVQLNITYPLDNDLTIDLIAPDGTDVSLSSFEGSGANFQNTTFDDSAATPIGAANSPFAGSYRPESPLSALAGKSALGTWQLQIVDWGGSAGTLSSWSLIIQPTGTPAPTATSLAVGGFPTSTTAGSAGSFTVTARDASGNVATGYTGTVHFSSSDPRAALPANYTFTTADAGSHTFSTTLETAGTQSLIVTDTAASGLSGTEAGIAVSPAAANSLKVSAPVGATVGATNSIVVTALDAYGNTATSYAGTVHFSSSDTAAGVRLPPDYTFTTSDRGLHTFSGGVTLQTAGSQTVTAADTVTGSISGLTTVSVVAPAPATHLSVGVPSGTTAGSAFSITVAALDANGHTATSYTGTVQLSSSDGRATLPARYTFTAADNGVHTFTGLVLDTAGTETVTARDSLNSSITGSGSVAVSPAPTSRLLVNGFPTLTTAGTPGSFTVTASDAYGNLVRGYSGTVHFSSTDPRAVLPANYTFTTADAGSHTFSATLTTAGTQSLRATDTVNGSLTGAGAAITVSPATASRLVVSAPAGATAGTAFSVTVTAQDAYGNTATGYAGTVHFTSSDGAAGLPVTSTLSKGMGTFSVTLNTAGSQTLTATDTAGGTLTGSAAISVSPAGSGALVFHSTDLPQALKAPSIVYSYIYVPQSVTIGSVKVQLNVTFPLDNELTIILIAPAAGPFLPHVPLSNFEGMGANFQDTTFDDAAATPISTGTSPFAGSYRPESPLSALAGMNAYGRWVLEVANDGPGSGTFNSWSLIITPAGSPSTLSAATTTPLMHGTLPAAVPAGAALGSPGLLVAALDPARLPFSVPPSGNTLVPWEGDATRTGLAIMAPEAYGANRGVVPQNADDVPAIPGELTESAPDLPVLWHRL
jgi:subtilisin-like proprotein convertase family protein